MKSASERRKVLSTNRIAVSTARLEKISAARKASRPQALLPIGQPPQDGALPTGRSPAPSARQPCLHPPHPNNQQCPPHIGVRRGPPLCAHSPAPCPERFSVRLENGVPPGCFPHRQRRPELFADIEGLLLRRQHWPALYSPGSFHLKIMGWTGSGRAPTRGCPNRVDFENRR